MNILIRKFLKTLVCFPRCEWGLETSVCLFFFVHYGSNAVSVRDKSLKVGDPHSSKISFFDGNRICVVVSRCKGARIHKGKKKGREATTRNLHKVASCFSLTLTTSNAVVREGGSSSKIRKPTSPLV